MLPLALLLIAGAVLALLTLQWVRDRPRVVEGPVPVLEVSATPLTLASAVPMTSTVPCRGESGSVVDLNTASRADLESLPGVGPVMAGRILLWREQRGRFVDVRQLREIEGIGEKTFRRLAPLVRVS